METILEMTTTGDLIFGCTVTRASMARQRNLQPGNASDVEKGIRMNFPRFMILARVRQRGEKWGEPGRAEITKLDLEPVQRGPFKTKAGSRRKEKNEDTKQ